MRAQRLAEAEGCEMLAAEALTVRGRIGDEPASTLPAAHAAWSRIGAPGRARAVAAAVRAAGLPAPVPQARVSRAPAADQDALTARGRALARLSHERRTNQQLPRPPPLHRHALEALLHPVDRSHVSSL